MRTIILLLAFAVFASCNVQKKQLQNIRESDIERILRTLSADDMQGRAAFTPSAEKAASFIENEFRQIGLQPMAGQEGFRQNFTVTRSRPGKVTVKLNGHEIDENRVVVYTDKKNFKWNNDVEVITIKPGENFFARFGDIRNMNRQVLVLADQSFSKEFGNLQEFMANGRITEKPNDTLAAVFVLGLQEARDYEVTFENEVQELPLFNVAGIIPGKSRPEEFVIFSAHYDHIGILKPANNDSIANGADDDASGVTAVITLARHFKEKADNERTLLFVAFTAEELGLVGSKYFSKQMDPAKVVAMFNIEMIGKESKFGKNAAFITGFERSDFGTILQKNLKKTSFTFHPDPYTEQNLFYRSDNATLAAAGVPAHTISTDQIDKDKFYHTVDDEFATVDLDNVTSTIKSIAIGSTSIVAGKDTPKRIATIGQNE